MRIYTKVVMQWDGEKYIPIDCESYEYNGEVALVKGSDVAKQQLDTQNALQKQQLDRQNLLTDKVTGSLDKYLSGDVGFTPDKLAAMQTQFLNSQSGAFGAANSALKSSLASRGGAGGQLPVGGDYSRGVGGLEGLKAASQAAGLNDIQLQNAQQALQNKFNSANAYLGNASIQAGNVGTFGSGASNALNQYIYAANQGFGNAFASGLGGALGKGIGNVGTSALGGFTGGLMGGYGRGVSNGATGFGCWIAEACFGEGFDTELMRWYLNGDFKQSWFGSKVMRLYMEHGEQVAEFINEHPWAKAPFRFLFGFVYKPALEALHG